MLFALVAMVWGSSAQAQSTKFLLTPGPSTAPHGGQLQIGTGLPLPVGTAGIFALGMTTTNPATKNMGSVPFPPLFIPPVAKIQSPGATTHIIQTQGTAKGGEIRVPAEVMTAMADGLPDAIGVFNTNPVVFQVATTLSYGWPSSSATFAPGGAPGPINLNGPPGGAQPGTITYSGGEKSFGGPATFRLTTGPGSGNYSVPIAGTMMPIATVWLALGALPQTAMNALLVGASNPLGMAAQGATRLTTTGPGTMTAPPAMTNFPGVPTAARTVNSPMAGTACTKWCLGMNGTVYLTPTSGTTWSHGPGMTLAGMMTTGPSNMATSTKGFPWTTGFLTVAQPGATGMDEVFILHGADNRVQGAGNIQLVAGALSQRALSMANANRAWLSLPEPTAALGTAAALGMLALCHGLVRRRGR